MADDERRTHFPSRHALRTNANAIEISSSRWQATKTHAGSNPTSSTPSASTSDLPLAERRNPWATDVARHSHTGSTTTPPRRFASRSVGFSAKTVHKTVHTNMGPPEYPRSAFGSTSSAPGDHSRGPFDAETSRFSSWNHRSSFPPATSVHRARTVSGLSARKSIPMNPNLFPFGAHNPTPINSQLFHQRSSIRYMTPSDMTPVKSTKRLVPSWHLEEDRQSEQVAPSRRSREDRNRMALEFIPRMSVAPTAFRRDSGRSNQLPSNRGMNLQNATKAYIGPNMDLRVTSEDQDSDIEQMQPGSSRGRAGDGRMATKAARKTDIQYRSSRKSADLRQIDASEDLERGSSAPSDTDSQPGSRATSPETGSDFSLDERRSIPSASIPDADIGVAARPSRAYGPSEELMLALERLTLSSLRMQKTKQLPFLLRNLRRGFENRCHLVGIPTEQTSGEVSVSVVYNYAAGSDQEKNTYTAHTTSWSCPLCELHGQFKTKEMLEKHLDWDHDQVGVTWYRRDTFERTGQTWKVELTITETEQNHEASSSPLSSISTSESDDDRSTPITQHTIASSQLPTPVSLPSLIAQMSTSAVSQSSRRSPSVTLSPVLPKFNFRELFPIPARSTSQSIPPRGRSTTAMSSTSQKKSSRYPTPPPPSDPLGPSAQPPYFPAKSEYGGPDIYYSCRPGGPRIYDLLNTLPMEPFGILSWAVIDREEEIFECDDIKDEYKVMHALWARWIMLNRNEFIANYHLGTVAFVDEYWRMIHRAAGWDALRYWLLMLLANRFISGSEVAKILRHYEGLTGMDSWYD